MTGVRTLAIAVTVLAGALASVLAVAPASASSGACQDPDAVTVVVDLTDLGGGVQVGCAGSGPMNGVEALQRAGFSVAGTQRQGLAFVCRIEGRPAADEKLTIGGRSGYREQCGDTPPPGAYWAYWYADPAGSWAYATSGPGGHQAIAGGYEGWRFELDRTTSKPLAPAFEIPPGTATAEPSSALSPTPPVPVQAAAAPAGGSPLATIAVVGVALVLVAGGGVTAWRRSRTR